MKAACIVHALDVIQMKELHLFIDDNLLSVVGDGDMEIRKSFLKKVDLLR